MELSHEEAWNWFRQIRGQYLFLARALVRTKKVPVDKVLVNIVDVVQHSQQVTAPSLSGASRPDSQDVRGLPSHSK